MKLVKLHHEISAPHRREEGSR